MEMGIKRETQCLVTSESGLHRFTVLLGVIRCIENIKFISDTHGLIYKI